MATRRKRSGSGGRRRPSAFGIRDRDVYTALFAGELDGGADRDGTSTRRRTTVTSSATGTAGTESSNGSSNGCNETEADGEVHNGTLDPRNRS